MNWIDYSSAQTRLNVKAFPEVVLKYSQKWCATKSKHTLHTPSWICCKSVSVIQIAPFINQQFIDFGYRCCISNWLTLVPLNPFNLLHTTGTTDIYCTFNEEISTHKNKKLCVVGKRFHHGNQQRCTSGQWLAVSGFRFNSKSCICDCSAARLSNKARIIGGQASKANHISFSKKPNISQY